MFTFSYVDKERHSCGTSTIVYVNIPILCLFCLTTKEVMFTIVYFWKVRCRLIMNYGLNTFSLDE